MTPTKDIHNYGTRYESALRQLKKSPISKRNKSLILDFDRACFLEGLSKPRRIRLIGGLLMLSKAYLDKDFDNATEKDIKEVVFKIQSREDYSVWTKQAYRAILKKFYKWLKYGDNYRQKMAIPRS